MASMKGGGDQYRLAGVHTREASFHDQVARDSEIRPPRDLSAWEHSLLQAAPRLEGLDVLELGCGDGELAFRLVDGGAKVSAIDISPGMVELAGKRLARFRRGADVQFVVAPAESTPFGEASFDLVVGLWVLHHTDLPHAIDEVARVLRPGGQGVFIETSALNPVLALARKHIVHKDKLGTAKCGTADEHPLTRRDVRRIASRFRRCSVDHPDFFLLYIFDRNVLKFRSPKWTKRFLRWDTALGHRAPFLGPLSYYLRIRVER